MPRTPVAPLAGAAAAKKRPASTRLDQVASVIPTSVEHIDGETSVGHSLLPPQPT